MGIFYKNKIRHFLDIWPEFGELNSPSYYQKMRYECITHTAPARHDRPRLIGRNKRDHLIGQESFPTWTIDQSASAT